MSVHQNKRTQAKSPSKMNGDNLLQLKYMKNAEISPRVLSFNMASRVQMSKRINWSYKEQALNLEKVKKGQYLYYKQLKRLEQEKRALQQQSYRYKQAEAKMDIEYEKRDKRIRKVLNDYEEKSRAIIDDILKATQKRQKKRSVESELNGEGTGEENGEGEDGIKEEERSSQEELESHQEDERQRKAEKEERLDTLDNEISDQDVAGNVRLRQVWRPADAEKHSERSGSVYIEYMYVKPGAKTLTFEAVEQHNSKTKPGRRRSRASPHQHESDRDSDQSTKRRLSLRRSSKTIEVNLKTPNEPKTVVRARSPVPVTDEDQTTDLPPLKTVKNRTKEPPPNSVLVENYYENGVQDAISIVEDANSDSTTVDLSLLKTEVPQLTAKARSSQQFRALPSISENKALVSQEYAEEDEDEVQLLDIDLREPILIVTPHDEVASIPDSRSRSRSSSDSHDSAQKKKIRKPKNNIEYNKLRQQEREEDRKKILDLPYTAYTMNKEGNVVAMPGPPKPMNKEPPTNYGKYRRDKLLMKTKVKQRIDDDHLQQFMMKIGEDVGAMPPPPNPNPDITIQEMADMIEAENTERELEKKGKKSKLPGNLMIFLQNKYDILPEDMDPDSMEALARCKYLRDYDVEAAKEAKKSGRRKSSWQVNPQTVGSSPKT